MFCPNCGSENLDSAKFCKNCGSLVGNNFQANQVFMQSGSSMSREKTVLLGIAAITVIFFGFFYFSQQGTQVKTQQASYQEAEQTSRSSVGQTGNEQQISAYKSAVRSMQSSAILTCDSFNLTYSNLMKSGMAAIIKLNYIESQDCGASGSGSFNFTVQPSSDSISGLCGTKNTTVKETGVTFPTGC